MIHLQNGVPGWLEAVDKLPAGSLVKAVSVQPLAEAKAHNAGVNTMLRYVNDAMQQVSPGDTEATREERARAWFDSFIDGTFLNGATAGIAHWKATDVIGWWNEYYADSQSAAEKELWWKQERTAARVWRDEYRHGPQAAKLGHIRLAIAAAAVGNNIPLQSAETATLYDAILDYHAYDKYFDGGLRDPLSWQYHCGRWNTMDGQFRAAGYTCRWLFGEAGPYGSAVTGWRHETIFGGDIARYVTAVRTWVREVKATHAYQTGRVLGFALFTTGGGSLWEWFETRQPELNALADMVKQEWTAVTPPPDPEPPPSSSLDAYLWQESEAFAAANGMNLHPNLYLWQLALSQGYAVLHTEIVRTYEGKNYAIQQARKPGAADRLYIFSNDEPIRWLDEGAAPPPVPHVERPLGVDVSHHQGMMNWGKAKAAGVYFAFIKATQRLNWSDPQFVINWTGAKQAGLLTAPYHYFQPQYDPVAQAEYFVSVVKATGRGSDLPYALDVEEDGNTPGFSDKVKACLNRIHQLTGRKPLLYCGIYYANTHLKTVTPAQADLWIANWTDRPDPNMPRDWSRWHFWQYSNSGDGRQYGAQSARIDLNSWNGLLAELYDYARG